jgi:hypothetical protein
MLAGLFQRFEAKYARCTARMRSMLARVFFMLQLILREPHDSSRKSEPPEAHGTGLSYWFSSVITSVPWIVSTRIL